MARGGKRAGAGRKAGVKPAPLADKSCAARLLDALNRAARENDDYEVRQWRELTEARELPTRLRARAYLYDKRDGKATQAMQIGPADGKPIEIAVRLVKSDGR